MSGSGATSLAPYLARLCPESPRLLNDCFDDGVAVSRREIRWPLLCLSGGKDDSPLHPRGQDAAVAAFLGAPLETIPRSGHCLMIDDGWLECAQRVGAWIRNT